jgi:hypothetical protein
MPGMQSLECEPTPTHTRAVPRTYASHSTHQGQYEGQHDNSSTGPLKAAGGDLKWCLGGRAFFAERARAHPSTPQI